MRLRDIHAPAPWSAAADRLLGGLEPVLVLGAVDTGKSTLVRYLLARLVAARGSAALLDGDVGMALNGPPGLVGLTLVRDVDAIGERTGPDRSWFVGSTTPQGALLPLIIGHARLMAFARAERLPVVVNTSGLVAGGLGKELALSLADVIEPRLVLGLGGEGEIEHLLAPLEARGLEVLRLPPSHLARTKPRTERTSLRAERFARYFLEAPVHELRLGDVALEGTLLGSGRPLPDADRIPIETGLDTHLVEAEEAGDAIAAVAGSAPLEEGGPRVQKALGGRRVYVVAAAETSGLLVGFLAGDGDCLGMGLLEGWKGDGAIDVRSPLDPGALKQARRLRFGTLRLLRGGEELGFAERERAIGGEA